MRPDPVSSMTLPLKIDGNNNLQEYPDCRFKYNDR